MPSYIRVYVITVSASEIITIISRGCETIRCGASKAVDLSVGVLPFSVIQVAYLISANWLPRIGLATQVTQTGVVQMFLSGYTKI